MSEISRRRLILSGAGVAALGLSGPLAFVSSAMAAELREKGYYRYKIGSDIEVTSIYDGVWQRPHDENFVPGVPLSEVKAALRKGGLTDEFVPLEFAFTIIKTGGKTVMIDSGTGGQLAPTAGLASASMKAAGISPDQIDTIVISHFHPDHIFGLMAKDTNAQIFPNAEILVNEVEYKFWTDPAIIEKLPEFAQGLARRIQATFPNWKNLTQYEGGKEVASGILAVDTPGHTPGHTAFHLASGNDELMLIGDLVNLPALFVENLDWQLVFDSDRDLATKTRIAMMERAVADNLIIAGYHFGFPNSGKIEKDGSGFSFVPVTS